MANRRFAGAAATALADQAAMSAASFVANAFLIHSAAKAAYGEYVVAFSSLLLIGSTVDVLFSLQMTYLAPHHPEEERLGFCAALRAAQTAASATVAVGICLFVLLASALGHLSQGNTRLGLVVAIGSLFGSWQEYYKSLFYLFGAPGRALSLTFVQISVWGAIVLVGVVVGARELGLLVLTGYCLGLGSAALLGRFLMPLPRVSYTQILAAAREAWDQGSWSMVGSVISWVQGQSYVWVLATLSSAEATAEANFARLFFSPLGLMLNAVNRVARPGLGTTFAEEGERRAVAQGRRLLVGIVGLVAVYCTIVISLRQWIINASGASAYANSGGLIVAWGAVSAVQVTRWNSTLLLGVLRRNRQMTTVQAVSASVAVVASFALIPSAGAMGAIASVAAGELLLSALMWRELGRTIN